jgi:hypothetical protein
MHHLQKASKNTQTLQEILVHLHDVCDSLLNLPDGSHKDSHERLVLLQVKQWFFKYLGTVSAHQGNYNTWAILFKDLKASVTYL